VNLASFAELAVRLVNSRACDPDTDPLRSCAAFREFVADRPFLAVPVTLYDLSRLRLLRTELADVFCCVVNGKVPAAVERLNALMMIHPVQPVLVSHDGEPLHMHLAESGSVTDRYAASSVISVGLMLSQYGAERLRICAIASCDLVFIDGSSNRSRRYCSDHSAARSNVTALTYRGDRSADQAGTVASAVS
jgi:predicted RNA-binding Zn ribbon-like protein